MFKTAVNNLPNNSEVSASVCASVTVLISLEIFQRHGDSHEKQWCKTPRGTPAACLSHGLLSGAKSLKCIRRRHLGNKISSSFCICLIGAHIILLNKDRLRNAGTAFGYVIGKVVVTASCHLD